MIGEGMVSMISFIQPEFTHSDDRGQLVQLVSDGWKQINVTFSRSHILRGGHYHKINRELFYIISGEVAVKLLNVITQEQQELKVAKNRMFVIEKFTVHTFDFLQDTTMLACYDMGVIVNKEMDIYNI